MMSHTWAAEGYSCHNNAQPVDALLNTSYGVSNKGATQNAESIYFCM